MTEKGWDFYIYTRLQERPAWVRLKEAGTFVFICIYLYFQINQGELYEVTREF